MVKINEFFNGNVEDSLPFDVVDDVAIYMRNDPMFYRKEFYPTIIRIKGLNDKNKQVNPQKELFPVVDRAVESYCKRFKIPKRPEELLSNEEKKALVDKIYSEEMTNIRKGAY